jgi:glycosyltransferase involved in cell wall biosynthesis
MNTVHVIVPAGIDDPTRPSGGNAYDRHVCGGLRKLGWIVHEHGIPGDWPEADPAARNLLAEVMTSLPDGTTVLADAMIGSAAPEALVPASVRVNLVALVHMPLADPAAERAVLMASAAVITTSRWTRQCLLTRHRLDPDRVLVATPGVSAATLAPGSPQGRELLCVGAVTPIKGYDVLLAALGKLDQPWRCRCVGALDLATEYAATLARQAAREGIADRVQFVGARTGAELDGIWASADLLVSASRAETYAMVVTEALARGLPVVATGVGGVPEALGRAPDGTRPGLLVDPEDPAALAGALRRWLVEKDLRTDLRGAALARRPTLRGWGETAREISGVLARVATARVAAARVATARIGEHRDAVGPGS